NYLELTEEAQITFIRKLTIPDGLELYVWEDQKHLDNEDLENLRNLTEDQKLKTLEISISRPGNFDFMNQTFSEKDDFRIQPITVKKHLAKVFKKYEQLDSAFEKALSKMNKTEFTTQEESFIAAPFPIAFILHNDEKLTRLQDEYRSTETLQIGLDVKTIVTDETNRDLLKSWLEKSGCKNIRVINLEQLKQGDIAEPSFWDFFKPKPISGTSDNNKTPEISCALQ
ncbi:MAG: hypothetical protein KDH94_01940, partial [Coxiellaceae bacterium]|nr:hypothetical protein [Coxiellaceae bacterium]